MEYKNNITLNPTAQEKFLEGISQVSEVIRPSYGPRGVNVSIEEELYPYHRIVSDAQSIIEKIWIEDPVERRGLNFYKELSDRISKLLGEGRKTTIILSEELLKAGFKEKVDKKGLKDDLDALLPLVLESIDKQSQPIDIKDIHKVALTSSRNKEIADKIQEIYNEIGKDGIIQVEGSGTFDTSYEVTEGVVFQGATWWHESMAHDEEMQKLGKKEEKAIYKKPTILFTKTKIRNEHEIADFIDVVHTGLKKDLVIFTDDIDLNVLSKMVAMHRVKAMNILVVKAPALWRDQIFTDFAKCVGADILEDGSGITWQNIVKHIDNGSFKLGTCDKLVTDEEGTVLTGIEDISAYKKELEEKADNESKRRLWRLNAKTAVLRLGAGSDTDLSGKLLKCNDALNACRSALIDGVVEGGAKSLVKASDVLPENIVGDIFRKALIAPNAQLVVNNGGKPLDTKGIYEATHIVKSCVRVALLLSSTILTTGIDIRLKEKTLEDHQIEMIQQKRFGFNQ